MPVLLSGPADSEWLARLREAAPEWEVVSVEDVRADPALLARVEAAFGGLRAEDLPGATSLRWLQTLGAGVDGLPLRELRARGVTVTNASGIHAEPIAEHVFGMLLALTRRLPEARDRQRERRWRPYDRAELGLLLGRTLGLWGVGAIGVKCAEVGRALGMRPIGLRRSGEPHPALDAVYSPAQTAEFLAECDVLVNSLPLTPATRHAMGWAEFAALKPGAVVVNVGRGATIHTDALIAALREGRVGAALLDVTDPEPLPPDHPLWAMPNVHLTAHYAGAHPGYVERAGEIFLENLRRRREGRPLANLVDPDMGY